MTLSLENKKSRIILLFFIAVFVATLMPVFADATRNIVRFTEGMFDDILMTDTAESVKNILVSNPRTTYPEVWDMITGIVDNVIIPASYAVLGLYFVTSIVRWGVRFEGITMEGFFKPFVSFLAAIICIQYLPYVVPTIINAAGTFATQIANAASVTGNTGDLAATKDNIKSMSTSMWSALVVTGQLFLPWIVAKALSFYMKVLAYSTVIEIFVRIVFMPFSFGDLCTRGLDGFGFRYVKAFAAVCLKGAIMVLIAITAGFFTTAAFGAVDRPTDWLKMIALMLVINASAAKMMASAGNFSREALGV